MRTTSAVLVSAALLAAGFVPTASAADETPPVSIQLTPGKGMWENSYSGWWEARSISSFTARFTDTGSDNLRGLTVFISVPGEYELYSYSGDRWDCWDTEGGYDCHIDDLVVPGEAWPELTVTGYVRDHMNQPDSIDVYATTGAYGWAHAGFPFKTNTST
ncbi:hypothetical protein Lesp02_26020 [Lentzea sp. NBRC 105346]|uniref:hypothetical protein n=1 Tax=Lentzea sp. NBRC 105346 TaxID=3032205 RepID=UPI0025555D05|nr:hypothetical protein [Lentzea sp. NBRC 105346]GLZ30413.1 hypothetical protein Lesp02_26020 [Lentzea sp. NBRC 105346]